jgi:hypothetical protein
MNILRHLNGKVATDKLELAQNFCRHVVPYFTFKNIALAFVAYEVLSFIVLAIYRVTFHPLAGFPGPFLAKISPLYEYYYGVSSLTNIQVFRTQY